MHAVLTELASDVAKDVAAQREVEAERATYRTTLVWIVVFLLGYTAYLVLRRSYSAPFGTPLGQVVLAAVAACYAGGLYWLHRLSLITGPAAVPAPRSRPGTRPSRHLPLAAGVPVMWLMTAGAAARAGIVLVIAGLRPAPPRLDAVLARISAPAVLPGSASLQAGLGGWMATHLARPGSAAIPRADLALLGRSPETFLVHKLAAAAAGLASFALLGLFFAATGTAMPWQIPAAASLAAGAGMFFFPDADVRAEAARRRRDFTHAFIAYLQLVRLARAAGAGTSEALEYAARIGSGWPFARIAAVASGRPDRAHEPPWRHLAALGEEIGVPEVSELAGTAEIAGSEGTKIAATLAAKTESLRGRLLADTRSRANSRTTTMIVPLSLLGLGLVLLHGLPGLLHAHLHHLTSTTRRR